MSTLIKVAALSFSFLSLVAWADTDNDRAQTSLSQQDVMPEANPADPQGWWIFVGGNTGIVSSDTARSDEEYVNGAQFRVKALGSYYFTDRRWLMDAGLGLQSSQLESGQTSRASNALTALAHPKYRIHDGQFAGWQVGPIVEISLVGDESFYSDSSGLATFLGAGANYEFVWRNKYPVRLGGSVIGDINVDHRNIITALFNVEIGFPVSNKRRQAQAEEPAAENAATVETEEPKTTSKWVPLTYEGHQFEMGRVGASKKYRRFLQELGKRLSENPDLVDRIEVSGHTDSKGKSITNEILSNSRAHSVLKEIAKQGVPADKFVPSGHADRNPVYGSKTDERNRRVEIRFIGVNDVEELNEIFSDAEKASVE